MSTPTHFVNGHFVPEDQAVLPVSDLGIIRGYGVFDLFRTYNGRPFKMREHLIRLQKSAQGIDIPLRWTLDELEGIIRELLKRNAYPESVVRIVLTGGPSDNGFLPTGEPSLAILVTPLRPKPSEVFERGTAVITVPVRRFMPTVKSLNYIPAIVAVKRAVTQGATEALYVDDQDHLLEGTRSNFFVFKGDTLITPREGILFGITRNVVLELAQSRFEIQEQAISRHELPEVDEAFYTSTTSEVMPVVRIDDQTVGHGRPGPRTMELRARFLAAAHEA